MAATAQDPHEIRLLSAFGLAVVGALATIYLVSQILRNSIGVIAPNLAAEIGLSASELGLLSSAFFIAFAAAQAPLGIAIDRFGPKPCMLVCAVILFGGAVLFSLATTPTTLIVARVLIGLGACCYLMAPLAFFARRFSPERFSTLAGLHIGIGTLGTLIATAPLAFSAAAIGWRASFLMIAAAVAGSFLIVALVVPGGRAQADAPRRESLRESFAGVVAAMRTPFVPHLLLVHFMSYSSFVLIVGLWGGPYLTHVYGYGLTERGDLLFLVAAGQIAGLFLNGPVERLFGSIKVPVALGSACTGGLLLLLAACGVLAPTVLAIWLVAFGVLSAYSPLLIAHDKALFSSPVLGRGLTLLNIGTMVGVFVSQTATGAIIDLFPLTPAGVYPLDAYRLIFALQGGGVLLATVPYLWTVDPSTAK